jgi:hypothetical protein
MMLVTQAMDFSDIAGAPTREQQTAAIERMKEIVRAVAAERQVPLVDAAPLIEAEAARQIRENGKEDLFSWEVHMFDPGADLLAQIVARAIVDRGIVQ